MQTKAPAPTQKTGLFSPISENQNNGKLFADT